MSAYVCDRENRDCMLNRCKSCPGPDVLKEHIHGKLSDMYDEDDTITYKQWLTTDRCTLESKVLDRDQFIDTLVKNVETLIPHHYISKAQSAYLTTLKENLSDGEVVALLDFAENYTFLVQDAAQSYHWNNTQATLHPVCLYCKSASKLLHKSLCVVSEC